MHIQLGQNTNAPEFERYIDSSVSYPMSEDLRLRYVHTGQNGGSFGSPFKETEIQKNFFKSCRKWGLKLK